MTDELAALFKPGITHGSTFGGNPLAAAAGLAVMNVFEEEEVLKNVERQSEKLFRKLEGLKERHPAMRDIRGMGLLVGIELGDALKDAVAACREKGLLVLTAGKGVMRLLPSLKLTDEELDLAIEILDQAIP